MAQGPALEADAHTGVRLADAPATEKGNDEGDALPKPRALSPTSQFYADFPEVAQESLEPVSWVRSNLTALNECTHQFLLR